MAARYESIRFARPTNASDAADKAKISAAALKKKAAARDEGLIRELYKRTYNDVWTPSFSVAFRILILLRVTGAMYSSVTADCDEVYNYWEPLHFILYGDGFRTWEYSPVYAIRSWAYLLLHAAPARLFLHVNPTDKRVAFFAVRICLAVVSTLCECRFYRSIVEHVNLRIGRYTFIFLLASAGMYNASTAFLPSSFSMHLLMLGWSYAIEPVTTANKNRTIKAGMAFSAAVIFGWPFTVILALPFVLEELMLTGRDTTLNVLGRLAGLLQAAVPGLAMLAFAVGIDSFIYGRITFVPWNIIRYNVLSAHNPNLYGTSPWYYYIFNNILNFNIILPLAFLSLPLLAITARFEPKKLGIIKPGQTPSSILLALRLMPFYIWFGLLSTQAHKEERFMFPAFPLLCWNAAVSLGLMRGWMQRVYVRLTKAPFNAARSPIFGGVTGAILLLATILSFSRIIAIQTYFRAPMTLMLHFQYYELPALAIYNYPQHYPGLNLTNFEHANEQIDVSILEQKNLTLCYGAEWYRFPSSFLVPDVVRTEFLQTELGIQLPKHFVESRAQVSTSKRSLTQRLEIARTAPAGFNDQNLEEMDRYVTEDACSYIIDLDFPARRQETGAKPTFNPDTWERVLCEPYLDSENSPMPSRAFSLPLLDGSNSFGDFCLLRNRKLQIRDGAQ